MNDLAKWRSEFPILSRTVYLISNSLGAMPAAAVESLAEYAAVWATRGARAWEERWFDLAGEMGRRVGAIIGAPDGSVSMHENGPTARAGASSARRWTSRRRSTSTGHSRRRASS